jgi:hypothetical protein
MSKQVKTSRACIRQRRLKEARIVFNGRKSVLSCLVRDVSDSGFRIKIGEPFRVPDIFELSMPGRAARPARKVWIGTDELGAAFT